MTYTDREKLACVEREIALRKNVYKKSFPNPSAAQKIWAETQIALMEAIAEDYREAIKSQEGEREHLF